METQQGLCEHQQLHSPDNIISMESNTTPQACAGVVNAQYVYPNNPAQHAEDL